MKTHFLSFWQVALLSLLFGLSASSSVAQVSFGNAQRFNDGWLFSLSADSLSLQPQYDDATWRSVQLPHDWSIEGIASPSLASCTGYLPAGIGWYRKHFTVSQVPSRKQYIYFEGIYNRSSVYLNGHLLGYRPSGFASFLYDMTPYLVEGDNVLSVKVDHSRNADSRWYTGSGIYRDVWRVEAPQNHLAQWGTGYVCKSLTGKSATIEVQVEVDYAYMPKQAAIQVELRDAAGKVVAKGKSAVLADKPNKIMLHVSNPHRWDLNDPYLYTMETTLFENFHAIDSNRIRVGLRSLQFDADKGFALNGRWMKVKGVCLHHDAGAMGAAVPDDVWRRKLNCLKQIGVNAIRCSHNPQAPVLYDLCDELGLLVMDEASDEWEFPKRKWVEGWNVGKPAYDGTYDFFEEWIDRDVTDMVRRDRNHPSIFLWSIGNEVDYPNDPYSHPVLDGKNSAINQPMFGGYDPKRPNAERIGKIAKRLAACVRAVDTSRPVTGALAGVVMSNETEYPEAVDVVGYNYTENRYQQDHQTYPKRVIYGSENGVGFDAWKAVRDNEFIFGQFIWTGTDYLGESGRWPSRGLHTGLLDFGSFAKPRGHFRAALWSESPVCYIGTYLARNPRQRRNGNNQPQRLSQDATDTWNYREGELVRVVCYTNAASARLLLNDKEIGAVKSQDPDQGIISWDVPFQPGCLKAEGLDAAGQVVSSYCINTSGRPYQLRATFQTLDGKSQTEGPFIIGANGNVAHILVEVLDEEGHLVKLADNNIRCEVMGPARLIGLENSDNADMGSHRDQQERVFNGRLLAYVQSQGLKGQVHVRFSSPLLQPADITLTVEESYPTVHDPVMARGEDGRYYIFSTGMGVGVMSSADLKIWQNEPAVFSQPLQWAQDSVPGFGHHFWAPDISYHQGLWHLYYSCSTFGKNGSAIGHATSPTLNPNDPGFGWTDRGAVVVSHRNKDNFNAIDPNLIVDAATGHPYLVFGSFWDGIQLLPLDSDFQTPLAAPRTVSRRVAPHIHLEPNADAVEAGGNAVEAPFIIYNEGYYYLFVSFDYCCRGKNSTYKTVYGRSKNIEGPYVDQKGQRMEEGGGTLLVGPDDQFYGIGHNAAYQFDGQWYFMAHAYDAAYQAQSKLLIRKFSFNSNGWIELEP